MDVADYTAVAHLILYGSITKPAAARPFEEGGWEAPQAEGAESEVAMEAVAVSDTDISDIDNTVYIQPLTATAGQEVTLSVRMKNAVEAEGFQFSLCLPEGAGVVTDADGLPVASLSTARTTARRTNTFQASLLSDGSLRVMAASTNASTFSGNDGEVCTVRIRLDGTMAAGAHALLLKDIAVSDADAVSHSTPLVQATMTVSNPSGIGEIVNSKTENSKCFDLQGRQITDSRLVNRKPTNGIYIKDDRKLIVRPNI